MPESLISILSQLPVVAVFVWFSMWMLRQFQEFLREERIARQTFLIEERCARGAQMDSLAKEMEKVSNNLIAMQNGLNDHDRRVAELVDRAIEKVTTNRAETKPRGTVR